MAKLQFPDEFLWGAAMSAHQVEGGNKNDWTEWEEKNAARWARELTLKKADFGCGPLTPSEWAAAEQEIQNPANYRSGAGVDHYNRWQEDITLAKSLNLSALRFSVEWSRVQSSADTFDQAAIDHYVDLAKELVRQNITPIITMHHFTNPLWFVELGGWESKNAPKLFAEYVKQMTMAFKDAGVVGARYILFNEPELYAMQAWAFGVWPPEKKNYFTAYHVTSHFITAHKLSYDTIKTIDPEAQVTSTDHLIDFEPKRNIAHPINKLAIWLGNWLFANRFRMQTTKYQDFIALNQYLHCVVDVTKILKNRGLFKNDMSEPRTDMGWFVHPSSMYRVLAKLPRKKPILIAENGFALRDDTKRELYLKQTLIEVHQAIQEGVPVVGYLHWSLLDGFEWPIAGWWAQFGLVAVDRMTMQRIPKPSAKLYANIISTNSLSDG